MTAPTLRGVYRGRGADELVLVDADGRAILLRGDGLTEDERLRMRERAFAVLSGDAMTSKQQNGSDTSLAATHPSLARRPEPPRTTTREAWCPESAPAFGLNARTAWRRARGSAQ